jgi:hypothetical protein
VPLVLETSVPTFGVEIPTLNVWRIMAHTPERRARHRDGPYYRYGTDRAYMSPPSGYVPTEMPMIQPHSRYSSRSRSRSSSLRRRSRSRTPSPQFRRYIAAPVSSHGNITATFQVPGLITIPTDTDSHNVTIAELELDASLAWVCVPKVDTKTRLSVRLFIPD